MKEKEIKEILKCKFQLAEDKYFPDQWKTVLSLFFKKIDYFSHPENLFTENNKVIAGKQIGIVKLDDGKQLAIFTVEVVDSISIIRNRQGLREIAAKHIDQNIIHGALAFFYNEKQANYRFSFIAKEANIDLESGELIKGETKPKRYTYLLGSTEACTTPAKRMLVLADKKEKGEVDINQLKEVFSVEALNKDFFKTYKSHYEKFWKYLADEENPYRTKLIDAEKDDKVTQEKPIRDFAKKLLGRIVFLHFLQKKGWMGCSPKTKDWIDGEPRFMQQLFKDFSKPEHFQSLCLTHLFFETLNTKRPNDTFDVKGLNGKLSGSRVPYLNGGLFEPEKNKATLTIDFPADYFKELLEFFEQYNFTIDENSPDDHEVGIDPEMLGHIFENLLEDNRDKGAFYTPKEIVQYMCKESLIQYLLNTFQEQKDIEAFIRFHTVSPMLAEKENAVLLNQKLDDIKVCDPAIGSGAFPIGMLQEIFEAKLFIYPHIKTIKPFEPADVKKNIIQNSIYGVDIEKGAVDIAQLRFWLTLVVEEENPHPLPNLDYKIMQGNSLLEKYEGIELGNAALFSEPKLKIIQASMFEEPEIIESFSEDNKNSIKNLMKAYFKAEDKLQKASIHKQIDTIVIEHIEKSLEFYENKLIIEIATYENILNNRIERLSQSQKNQYFQKSKEAKEIEKRQIQLKNKTLARKRLLEFENTDERPYFLWHLYFMDVFEKGGFDVMIGNPPYIQIQKISLDERTPLAEAKFKTYTGTSDIYCLFYEIGFNLLKKTGTLNYITSNTWMRTNFGESLRFLFSSTTNPIKLLNFEDTQIFPAATVETNILIAKNELFNGNLEAVAIKSDFKIKKSISKYFDENKISLDSLSKDGWIILDQVDNSILNSIKSTGVILKHWDVEFYRGMLTGFNDAFYINEEKREELIKKDPLNNKIIKRLIRGREIRRWYYDFNDNYAIYPHNGVRENKLKGIMNIPRINVEKDYPYIYQHLLQFKDKDSPLAVKLPDGSFQTLVDRTDQGDHWTNLRNCAYIMQLEDEKLVWLAITDKPAFAYDNKSTYVSNPSYFMSGKNLKYLLGFLNSRVIQWYMDKITSSTGQGTNQWNKMYIELLPVPLPKTSKKTPYELLSDYLIYINQPEIDDLFENVSKATLTVFLESLLDMIVFEAYFEHELKSKEIDILQFITEDIIPDISELSPNEIKTVIQKVYYELQQKDNPIRNRILVASSRSETIARINAATS